VREHPRGRADEIGAADLLGGEAHDAGRRVGERDTGLDRRPADERGALPAAHAEERTDAPEAACAAGALAQFRRGPGRRQARAMLLALGCHGTTATAPSAVWIQAIRRTPQEPASRRTMRGRRP